MALLGDYVRASDLLEIVSHLSTRPVIERPLIDTVDDVTVRECTWTCSFVDSIRRLQETSSRSTPRLWQSTSSLSSIRMLEPELISTLREYRLFPFQNTPLKLLQTPTRPSALLTTITYSLSLRWTR